MNHKYKKYFHNFIYKDQIRNMVRIIDKQSSDTYILRLLPLDEGSLIFSAHIKIMPEPNVCYTSIATSIIGNNLKNLFLCRDLFHHLGINEVLYKRGAGDDVQIKSMKI